MDKMPKSGDEDLFNIDNDALERLAHEAAKDAAHAVRKAGHAPAGILRELNPVSPSTGFRSKPNKSKKAVLGGR